MRRDVLDLFFVESSRSSGLPESLLLKSLDDFLVLHAFLVEVNLWDSRDHFVKLQLVLPLLDIWDWLADWLDCCWTSASLAAAFPLLCDSPRTSPCLGRSPLVCFAYRWLCSSLACCWPCSSLACCWLCSSACCWLCPSASCSFPHFSPSRR